MRKLLLCVAAIGFPQVALADPFGDAVACYEHVEEGRPIKALEACTRALNAGKLSDTNAARTFNNRGRAHMRLNRFEPAQEDFSRALALTPDFAQARNNRGVALARLEKAESARSDFDAAIKQDPEYANAYFNRAMLSREGGDIYSALADLDKAMKYGPQLVAAREERQALIKQLGAALPEVAADAAPAKVRATSEIEIAAVASGFEVLASVEPAGETHIAEAIASMNEAPGAAEVLDESGAPLGVASAWPSAAKEEKIEIVAAREPEGERAAPVQASPVQAAPVQAAVDPVEAEQTAAMAAEPMRAAPAPTPRPAVPAKAEAMADATDAAVEAAAEPQLAEVVEEAKARIETGDLSRTAELSQAAPGRTSPAPAPLAAPDFESYEAALRGGRVDVAKAQAKLTELGYDPGPVDGAYGPQTRGALRRCLEAGCALDLL